MSARSVSRPLPEGGYSAPPAPAAEVRGEALLRRLEAPFLVLNRLIQRAIPVRFNPFVQTGAIANVTFLIALITGILLLFWYSPSLYTAYASVGKMGWLGQLLRSLHRYSSDACLFFVLWHAAQLFLARRFHGARWVAWVSGVALAGILWLEGWLGYWLVWDERARQIALGSAKFVEVLPIFADPLSRSFLADATINTFLFFVIFFMHMLIPMAMGAALWIHIARVKSPRFLTSRPMTLIVLGALVILALLLPASQAKPAHMALLPQGFTIDVFYMGLPLFLLERLSGGVLWLLFLLGLVLLVSLPWTLAKGKKQARRTSLPHVMEASCNGCSQCFQDCPYNAITMLPNSTNQHGRIAQINPDKCVACGICVGSCNPAGIDFPRLRVQDVRKNMETWLEGVTAREVRPYVAFLCRESAPLPVDAETGLCDELPGYFVFTVPCIGWVHPLMIERAIRHGAAGALLVGCPPGDPVCRLGTSWTEMRLRGLRQPALRSLKLSPQQVSFLQYDHADRAAFLAAAKAFRQDQPKARLPIRLAVGALLLLGLNGTVAALSDAPYVPYWDHHTEFVVSFKLAGKTVDASATTASKENLLPHMRGPVSTQRERAPVRLRVLIDGKQALAKTYPPRGLFGDGKSIAMESFPVAPGKHVLRIEIGDTGKEGEWNYVDTKELEFMPYHRHVAVFEGMQGFKWY